MYRVSGTSSDGLMVKIELYAAMQPSVHNAIMAKFNMYSHTILPRPHETKL